MQHAFRVCRLQCVDHFRRHAQRVVERQRAVQGRAFQVLHHEVVGADVVQDADVRMIQRGDGPRFVLDALALPGHERLDRHSPAQAGVEGLVDLPHATGTQLGEDFIRAETGARSQ